MADEVTHEDNATPDATDDDIKRMDADTPGHPAGASADEGAGSEGPVGGGDPEDGEDPKEAGKPV